MRQSFRKIKLSKSNKVRLDQINSIIIEYQQQGYRLTLRQLYYQLVSRDMIPNQPNEYKKLGRILTEGRMSGIVDWDAIEDRVRVPKRPSYWESPNDAFDAVLNQYRNNRMDGQDSYLEVWVEKDALSGVLSRVTKEYGINILVNRGYSSASAMYDAYNRFSRALLNDQKVTVLYLGDFDPSGVDMVRDIEERSIEFLSNCQAVDLYSYKEDLTISELIEERFSVQPIALTKKQIALYNPPPNIAKASDSRYDSFASEHGGQSWEVDALKPEVLNRILKDAIEEHIDLDLFYEIKEKEESDKAKMRKIIKDNF